LSFELDGVLSKEIALEGATTRSFEGGSTVPVSFQSTADKLQIAGKLLEILSPYAVRTRTDMVQRRGRFVHYTSAENGLKIINTRTIWMRNTNCMSDYREVQHGQERLKTFFSDLRNRDEFESALNACVDGCVYQKLRLERSSDEVHRGEHVT
jgi:hypothetical protein